jgi:hypothetical protein
VTLRWSDIGPDTKLEAVLRSWPELERTLVELSPSLRALENPLLRSTFARVASLRQVAEAGGLELAKLLEELGASIGAPDRTPSRPAIAAPAEEPPVWAARRPLARHDAREDVARGVHPLPDVLAELETLPDGEVFELLTPMLPAPLLGLLERKGFEAHVAGVREGLARTVIRRKPA